jgi:hypothetical protein
VRQRLLVPLVSVAVMLSIAGCSSGTATTTTQSYTPPTTTQPAVPTGANLLNSILQSTANLKTFSYSGTWIDAATYQGSSFNSTLNMSGRQDNTAQKQYGKYTFDQTSSAQEQFETYTVNGWLYMLYAPASPVPSGLTPGTWYRSQLDATAVSLTFTSNDSTIFKGATLTVNGAETLNGVSCWKVTAVPDVNQLATFLVNQGEISAVTDLDQPISNVSLVAWVTQDSSIVSRETLKLTMLVQGITVNVSFDSSVTGINQPVIIDLPAAAANAIQVG